MPALALIVVSLLFIYFLLLFFPGLPIFEKELLRVKRKGDLDEDKGQRLHRRDLDLLKEIESLEDDVEIRRKRRFYTDDSQETQDVDKYPNKMAARSSRSSREDNDITARGMERFLVAKGTKQPANIHPGSGMDNKGSGSGAWEDGVDTKEEPQGTSLENMVAALSDEGTASASGGVWGGSGSDDELPKFFSAAASNSNFMELGRVGSGSGDDKQANLVSDLAEELHQQTNQDGQKQDKQAEQKQVKQEIKQDKPDGSKQDKPDGSTQDKPVGSKPVDSENPSEEKQDTPVGKEKEQDGPAHPKQKRSSEPLESGNDLLHRFFEGPGIIHRFKREKIDNSLEERLASFFRNLKDDAMTSNDPDTSNEPPPIPAITAKKRKSKVTKIARNVGKTEEGEELTGLNLVKRFYKDQDMDTTTHVKVYPNSVSPLNVKPILVTKKEKIETKPQVEKIEEKPLDEKELKRENIFEPRVVHQQEIPRTHVTIIEEPAVYSKIEDGMETSDGGQDTEDDESEAAIEIHERDIREDGMITN